MLGWEDLVATSLLATVSNHNMLIANIALFQNHNMHNSKLLHRRLKAADCQEGGKSGGGEGGGAGREGGAANPEEP